MIGIGNTAEVFEYGVGKVCKLFFQAYSKEYVALEYQNAKELYELKLSVPKAFEIVTIDNRRGIIYERINGKPLSNFIKEDTSNASLDLFVNLHNELLSHHCQNLLSYKEFLTTLVTRKSIENPLLIEQINALPDGTCICHGDFHPNNVLMGSNGTPVIIDFLNVCSGPYLYDIARTFFLLDLISKPLAKQYLSKMNLTEKDFAPYSRVIQSCRAYES